MSSFLETLLCTVNEVFDPNDSRKISSILRHSIRRIDNDTVSKRVNELINHCNGHLNTKPAKKYSTIVNLIDQLSSLEGTVDDSNNECGISTYAEADTTTDANKVEDFVETSSEQKANLRISFLQRLLRKINKRILRLEHKELTIDDLEAADSVYIREAKLKRHAYRVWRKLCAIQGVPHSTGRPTHRRFKFNFSENTEINEAVTHIVNKKRFPDFQDIRDAVLSRLKDSSEKDNVDQLAMKIFRKVGLRLQAARMNDLHDTLLSRLPVTFDYSSDPALNDEALNSKLTENQRMADNRLDEILEKYCDIQANRWSTNEQMLREKINEMIAHIERCDDNSDGEDEPEIIFLSNNDCHTEGKNIELPMLSPESPDIIYLD